MTWVTASLAFSLADLNRTPLRECPFCGSAENKIEWQMVKDEFSGKSDKCRLYIGCDCGVMMSDTFEVSSRGTMDSYKELFEEYAEDLAKRWNKRVLA